MFGKGNIFPFNSAPLLIFGDELSTDNSKPFTVYNFMLKIRDNKISYKFKMPFWNPTKIFTPLALAYTIEYVYFNFSNEVSFEKSKKVMLDMLAMINDRKFNENNLVNGVLVKNAILVR